jgi:acyl-CoA dehydrogenase
VVVEEFLNFGAPVGSHWIAERQSAPLILRYGTQEQKRFYIPAVCRGEMYFCIGMSEPNAGSDLASVRTRASRNDKGWVLNGQKIWTTNAHRANRMFALVRTATSGKRQDGITFVLFDMDTPGITVRPIMGNGGDHEFNEVFFNDARVPMSNRIGEENKGWEVAKFLLEFERGGRVLAGQVRAQFAKLVQLMNARGQDDSALRARLAEIGTDLDAMEMIDISVLSTLQTGGNPGPISSLLKLRWSEIRQSIAELAMDVIGDEALRWFPERPLYETLQLPPEDEEMAAMVPRYLNSRAFTIMGGTSEIQTNILAKSLVGL